MLVSHTLKLILVAPWTQLENVPKTALELVTLPSEDFMAGFHGPWRKACIATLFLQNDHATERR